VPGAILLLAIVVYPSIATIRYSFFNGTATKAVGLANYRSLFSTADTLIAFRNNVIWVIAFPFIVTVIGLVFAVLSEHNPLVDCVQDVIFLPVVFSVTASSLVFTQIFQLDPHVGVLNAIVQTVEDWYNPPGAYPLSAGQTVSSLATSGVVAASHGTLESSATVRAGGTVRIGLTGISPDTLTVLGARPRECLPQPRELSPAWCGATSHLHIRATSPRCSPTRTGCPHCTFHWCAVTAAPLRQPQPMPSAGLASPTLVLGAFRVQVQPSKLQVGLLGTFWLGPQSLTPTNGLSQTAQALLSVPLIDISMIMAYLWIWAGFTMVVVAAGLAALDREVLEAAHVDGLLVGRHCVASPYRCWLRC